MKYTHNPGKRCQFFKHLRVGKISSEIKKVAYKKLLIDQNVVLKGVVEAKNEMLSDHYLRVRLPDSVEQGSYASASARAVQFIL